MEKVYQFYISSGATPLPAWPEGVSQSRKEMFVYFFLNRPVSRRGMTFNHFISKSYYRGIRSPNFPCSTNSTVYFCEGECAASAYSLGWAYHLQHHPSSVNDHHHEVLTRYQISSIVFKDSFWCSCCAAPLFIWCSPTQCFCTQ